MDWMNQKMFLKYKTMNARIFVSLKYLIVIFLYRVQYEFVPLNKFLVSVHFSYLSIRMGFVWLIRRTDEALPTPLHRLSQPATAPPPKPRREGLRHPPSPAPSGFLSSTILIPLPHFLNISALFHLFWVQRCPSKFPPHPPTFLRKPLFSLSYFDVF